jgi:pyruvate dehydrogenase E2 component (dihydrolipoamide acetyltransferase)
MGEVTMPRLSDTMSEGTVGRWLKKQGDMVAVGEIIAEIETDKATMELESFEAGPLSQIVIPEGQTVPIGQVIAYIGGAPAGNGTSAPAAPAAAEVPVTEAAAAAEPAAAVASPAPTATAATPAPPAATAAPAPNTNGVGEDERLKVSPVARRIAEEKGVDLRQVVGTGPGGRIIKENVEDFIASGKAAPVEARQAPAPTAPAPAPSAPAQAPAPAPTPAPQPTAPTVAGAEALGRMRKAIARAMNESKPGVPHIYVTIEIDMDAAMALREQIIASGTKVSVNDIVVKAAAKALHKVPAVNTAYSLTAEGQPGVVRHSNVNVSVAVALEDGLIAPVVKDADKKSVGTISAEIRDMAGRAREGKIKQNELEGATFQVTNLGMFGVTEFGSIITVPQAASLAVGAVRKVPVVRNDAVVVGQVMNVTLSADHRIVDGAVAAQYLQELKKLLEAPMSILI